MFIYREDYGRLLVALVLLGAPLLLTLLALDGVGEVDMLAVVGENTFCCVCFSRAVAHEAANRIPRNLIIDRGPVSATELLSFAVYLDLDLHPSLVLLFLVDNGPAAH
jgi:hypothetical protein